MSGDFWLCKEMDEFVLGKLDITIQQWIGGSSRGWVCQWMIEFVRGPQGIFGFVWRCMGVTGDRRLS